MKEQYVGDINDFQKYQLLRRLAAAGLSIGVCWMLTPPDGRSDGAKTGYLREPQRWRHQDPELFDLLASAVGQDGHRSLMRIESCQTIPGAIYFNRPVPDNAQARSQWVADAIDGLGAADLVFFDPDNGFDVPSIPNGTKGCCRYIYRDEVMAAYGKGCSVLVYQHFPRQKRDIFLAGLIASLDAIAPPALIWSFQTAHAAFVLLAQPRHLPQLKATFDTDNAASTQAI